MDLDILSVTDSETFATMLFDCLALHGRSRPKTLKILSSSLKKKRSLQVLRIEVKLLDILIEFFISDNQPMMSFLCTVISLKVCTRTFQQYLV